MSRRPYFREILDSLADPLTRRVSVMGGAQLGKTTALEAALLALSDIDPAPGMLVTPDKEKTLELREEIYGLAEECDRLKQRIPPAWRRNARHLDFGRCVVYLAWSGGKQTLRGRSCKRVLATEVDVYQHDPVLGSTIALLEARTKAWFESMILEESTPSDENSLIATQFEMGDQRRWHVQCPHCRHWQELRFFPHKRGDFAGRGGISGYTDDAGNLVEPEVARRTAFYLCEQGCRIEARDKAAMVLGGLWVPLGQSVSKAGKLTGTPDRSTRHRSYHLSALLSDRESWGSLAAQYLTARLGGTLREFFNNILGLKFSTRGKSSTWQQLATRHAGAYRKHQVPAAADFITCSCDVQGGDDPRAYWIVRGWGPWKTSWLIDWGVKRPRMNELGITERNSDLAQLAEVLMKRYTVIGGPNALGKVLLVVRVQGVDTNYRMHDIHDYLKSQDADRVRALRGDHSVERAERYRMTKVERSARDGKPYPGGLELWGIATQAYREALWEMLAGEVDQPGAWYLPEDVIEAEGKDYLQQVCNKFPKTTRRPSGKLVKEWLMRSKLLGDHYFDCEVMALALADMVVGALGWDPADWPWRVKSGKQVAREPVLPREDGGFSAR